MSELKAYNATIHPKMKNACDGAVEVYLKSEADKVIARLESDIVIKDNLNKLCLSALRHQKYKRCLAMARIAQDDWHLHNSFYAMGHQEFEKRKCEFYEKWHKRWLELAEKFKEEK